MSKIHLIFLLLFNWASVDTKYRRISFVKMEDVEAKKIPSQSVKFQYLASIVGKKENH